MKPDPETIRRHRVLGDPSRARVLTELAESGPLDVHELAARTGLHVSTLRSHLAALVEAGLAESEAISRAGPGRPRLAYRATEAGSEDGRRYRLLAEILTTLVARLGDAAGPELERISEAWGHYLVESPPPFAPLSQEETRRRLVGLLGEVGFQPRLAEDEDGSARILMRPCAFIELARRHPQVVCAIHLGLMRGALAELGGASTATSLEPFVRPDLCVAHLGPASSDS